VAVEGRASLGRAPLRVGRERCPRASCRSFSLALPAVAALAAFAGTLHKGWVHLDDPEYVFQDPYVLRGWTLSGSLRFLHEPHGKNWHPLTSWSHMLDLQWFGLRPGGHHAVSLVLHALNALLLAFVLSRLTGGWWRSVLVAGLFALHPPREESVAWIAERKDVLSAFFFLLRVDAYRRWVGRPTAAVYAAARRFPDATRACERAIELARSAGETEDVERGAAPEIPGRDSLAPRVARRWTGRVAPRERRPAVDRAARWRCIARRCAASSARAGRARSKP
jgi:hypothetical protein